MHSTRTSPSALSPEIRVFQPDPCMFRRSITGFREPPICLLIPGARRVNHDDKLPRLLADKKPALLGPNPGPGGSASEQSCGVLLGAASRRLPLHHFPLSDVGVASSPSSARLTHLRRALRNIRLFALSKSTPNTRRRRTTLLCFSRTSKAMMTESTEDAVPAVVSGDTVATVAPSQARRHSDPIQPPPAPSSPYAFPPTYEEAMASKALEEGNLSPEALAALRRDFPGRELEAQDAPRERLSNRVFVRQRVFIFRVCLYTFILLLVVAAIVISVIKSTDDIPHTATTASSPTTVSSPPRSK
uniref:Cation_ATPase_N domain-containing protein n=1 Tax=Steinernema glaseri TaxID=37863 RepID=A0A1I7YD46_9BILA